MLRWVDLETIGRHISLGWPPCCVWACGGGYQILGISRYLRITLNRTRVLIKSSVPPVTLKYLPCPSACVGRIGALPPHNSFTTAA